MNKNLGLYKDYKEFYSRFTQGGNKLSPMWVTGITDAEGNFSINYNRKANKFNFSFKVTQNMYSKGILLDLKTFFKCGNIYVDNSNFNTYKFVVSDRDSLIKKVLPHFDSHPLLTSKKLDYLDFRKICIGFNSVHKNDYDKILSAKNGMNSKRSFDDRWKFYLTKPIITDEWLQAFIDGEGSFQFSMSHTFNRNKKVWTAYCSLEITQSNYSIIILDAIKQHLGVGSLKPSYDISDLDKCKNSKPVNKFVTTSVDTIVSFVDKYPMFTSKALDYADWKSLVLLKKDRAHTTPEGRLEIIRIRQGMNAKRYLDKISNESNLDVFYDNKKADNSINVEINDSKVIKSSSVLIFVPWCLKLFEYLSFILVITCIMYSLFQHLGIEYHVKYNTLGTNAIEMYFTKSPCVIDHINNLDNESRQHVSLEESAVVKSNDSVKAIENGIIKELPHHLLPMNNFILFDGDTGAAEESSDMKAGSTHNTPQILKDGWIDTVDDNYDLGLSTLFSVEHHKEIILRDAISDNLVSFHKNSLINFMPLKYNCIVVTTKIETVSELIDAINSPDISSAAPAESAGQIGSRGSVRSSSSSGSEFERLVNSIRNESFDTISVLSPKSLSYPTEIKGEMQDRVDEIHNTLNKSKKALKSMSDNIDNITNMLSEYKGQKSCLIMSTNNVEEGQPIPPLPSWVDIKYDHEDYHIKRNQLDHMSNQDYDHSVEAGNVSSQNHNVNTSAQTHNEDASAQINNENVSNEESINNEPNKELLNKKHNNNTEWMESEDSYNLDTLFHD